MDTGQRMGAGMVNLGTVGRIISGWAALGPKSGQTTSGHHRQIPGTLFARQHVNKVTLTSNVVNNNQ